MLLFVATLSLTFAACGGDDGDEPDGPDKNSGKVNTAVAYVVFIGDWDYWTTYRDEDVALDAGCSVGPIIHRRYDEEDDGKLYPTGGEIVYAGDFDDLSRVTTAPLNGYNNVAEWYDGGCYIVHSNKGTYIRLKAELSADYSYVTYKFQTFRPTNIQ